MRLSRDFTLEELPGYEHASPEDIARVQETIARVLQPIRNRFGVPVRVTSWRWWSSGAPREGAHEHGGTVDYVVDGGLTRAAFEWAAETLIPSGYIGRLIYEPERSAAEGEPQGEHIHVAPRDAMLQVFGDAKIEVLEEQEEGRYTFFRAASGVGLGALAILAGWFFLAGRGRPVTS